VRASVQFTRDVSLRSLSDWGCDCELAATSARPAIIIMALGWRWTRGSGGARGINDDGRACAYYTLRQHNDYPGVGAV